VRGGFLYKTWSITISCPTIVQKKTALLCNPKLDHIQAFYWHVALEALRGDNKFVIKWQAVLFNPNQLEVGPDRLV
jgi:hypothetical protein